MKTQITILILALNFSFNISFSQQADEKTYSSHIYNKKINIDGRLDEKVWDLANTATNFIQTEPEEGKPATEKTEVKILYDEKNLYFGIICYDSNPDKITATEMRRDSKFENDDFVAIMLDTYHDHRNAMVFTVNALGAKLDVLITDEGANINQDWNGIWYCDAEINAKGWTAELSIPFNTLRFEQKQEITFGFNILRMIARKREEVYWMPMSRDYGHLRMFKISAYGHLNGLKDIQQKQNFELKPFVLSGVTKDFEEPEDLNKELKTGIDLKYKLTPNLIADITYNTDFAQVEADEERVNLTRFDLFYPEKREFFLEGADIFTFGERAKFIGEMGRNLLFFSRRIGISEDGEKIPIIGGTKITGKINKNNIGFLNLTTNDKTYINDDDEEVHIPKTNFTVLRTKRDILSKSYVGLLFTNKDKFSSGEYDRSIGLDFDFNFHNNLKLGGYLAGNYSPVKTENNLSGYLNFVWGSDLHNINISYIDIGKNFDPEMGFIRRTDIKRTKVDLEFSPRPSIKFLRKIYFFENFSYLTDHNNKLLTRNNFFGIFNLFENGSRFMIGYSDNYDFLDETFEVKEDAEIPVGLYKFSSFFSFFQSDGTKDVWIKMTERFGEFYNGKINSLDFTLNLKPYYKFIINLRYNRNDFNLPVEGGKFSTNILSSRINFSYSPKIFTKIYIQYNDSNNILLSNFLFNYIYREGANLYLVFNQAWESGIKRNNTILLKINHYLNF